MFLQFLYLYRKIREGKIFDKSINLSNCDKLNEEKAVYG